LLADITIALNAPINKEDVPKEYLFEDMQEEKDGLFSKKALAEKGYVSQSDIASVLALFEDAKTFGSLMQVPPQLAAKLPEIEKRLDDVLKHGDLTHISASIKAGDHDYHLQIVELHISGPANAMTLATFVALCSAVFGKPLQQQMVVLGSMSLGGNIVPVENLAESLQVAFDAGAKRLMLPMASVKDIPTIPGELFAKFQTGFYADPVDAVFKALGVQ